MKIIIYWRFRKYKYIQIIIYWIFQTCLAVGTFAGSVQVLVHVSYLSKMKNVNKNVNILFIFYIDFTHKHVSGNDVSCRTVTSMKMPSRCN